MKTWMVAIVRALVVALVAAGCGGNGGPAPARPIQQEAATTTSGATGSTSQALVPGPLEPGTYETVRFRPKLSFTVGEGWGLLGDNENGIALAPKFDRRAGAGDPGVLRRGRQDPGDGVLCLSRASAPGGGAAGRCRGWSWPCC
jgi:hypothetical protein